VIVHSRCDQQWTALGAAHCGECHRTFSSTGLFDKHRYVFGEHGACLDPAEMMNKGQRAAYFRDGMWRGPELSDEQRARLYGTRVD
jgi:hypothetical protein